MSKKHIFLTAVALVLVCVFAVSGTLAFLKRESKGTINTFIAAGEDVIEDVPEETGDDPHPAQPKAFEIVEHDVQQDDKGNIITGTGTASTGNEYKILPGLTLPKDAKVRIVGKNDVPVYLFVEIVDGLDYDIFEKFSVADVWLDLGIKGANGGEVYVYAADKTNATIYKAADGVIEGEKTIGIIKDDQIKVKDSITEDDLKDMKDQTLSFYAYMAQASAGETALEAFNACFPAATEAASTAAN